MQNRTKVIATYDKYDFAGSIEYMFSTIFSIYGASYHIAPFTRFKSTDYDFSKVLVVSYGKRFLNTEFRNQIHIYASELFSKNYLKPDSMPETPLKKYGEIPVIYCGRGNFDGFIRESENLIETNIDIIASFFFMLSRYEEIVLDKKDKFNRFSATESLAYKEGFLDRPIVNEYIELLWEWIDSFNLGFKRRKLWGDKDFAVCLTHDVDSIRKYRIYPPLRTIGGSILGHRDLRKAFAITIDYLRAKSGRDPYDNFDYIMDL